MWEGEFEGRHDVWLRWCYQDGTVLLTGDERATHAEQRVTQAEQRAIHAEERAKLLAEQLRGNGHRS